MNKSLLVIGYFGEVSNQIDGQTIKTREVYKLLATRLEGNSIEKFDTELLKKSKWSIFILVLKVIKSRTIIYLPGRNNFKLFFPLLFFLAELFEKDIIHIVVGGWLVDFLEGKPNYSTKLKRIKKVLIESEALRSELETKLGFVNVQAFPNFRIHNFVPSKKNRHQHTFRAVFMSRVTYSKGINLIFELVERLKGSNVHITVDLYGPLVEEESLQIISTIERIDCLSYKGIIQPQEVFSVLSSYDVLLLPTSYEGEGFPGAIMDAYIAGIPVIASQWKQIPEFVDHGETGFLFPLNDKEKFFQYVMKLYENEAIHSNMKKQAQLKSGQYSAKRAWEILKPIISDI